MWSFINFKAVSRHSNHFDDMVQGNKFPSSLKNKFDTAVVFVTGVWNVPDSHVSWDTENTQVLCSFPQLCLANADISSSLAHKRWLLIIPISVVMDLTAFRNNDISSWLFAGWLPCVSISCLRDSILRMLFPNYVVICTVFFPLSLHLLFPFILY
jgi:hypothetical protein